MRTLVAHVIPSVVRDRLAQRLQTSAPLDPSVAFDLLLPANCPLGSFDLLEIDQPLDPVTLGEPRDQALSVLADSPEKIARHAYVETLSLACQDVDEH